MLCRLFVRTSRFRKDFIRSKCDSINNIIRKEDPRSAGVIVIGDEILKGQVHDTNSHFIVKNMFRLGVKVRKITVVGDIEDEIADEVKAFSKEYTYVITTGGIGPTHDDITYQAVAKAFDDPLVPHPELVKLISDYYKTDDLNCAAMRMAHIPKSAKITYGYDKVKGTKTLFPNISIKNIYMFPGIPQLMEKLFYLLCEDLFGGGSRQFFVKELYINTTEANLASTLNIVVAEFPKVNFGSYPKLFNRYFKVLITVECEVEEEMNRAYNRLKDALYKAVADIFRRLSTLDIDFSAVGFGLSLLKISAAALDVVAYDKDPLEEAYEKLLKIVNESNNPVFKKAVDLIEDCLQKYSSNEMCIYFDGGIESICVLHIYYALLLRRDAVPKIKTVCIKASWNEQNLESFINETISRYNLQCEILEHLKSSTFRALLEQQPHVKAVIIGNVITETQHVSECLKVFNENTVHSSIRWVMPLLDWKSDDLRKFMTSLTLPYCEGYESSKNIDVLLEAVADMTKQINRP